MCKAVDAAYAMINRAIDLAEQTEKSEYLLDYSKVHKLLYIAQCQMLATYNRPLFDDKVRAHGCGPRVDGIDCIPIKYGFNEIHDRIPLEQFAMPSFFRLSIIDWTLQQFGTWDIEDLVAFTKATPAYEAVAEEISEKDKPEIGQKQMARSAPSIMV